MTPHNLAELAAVANQPLAAKLLELHVFAVEAPYEEAVHPAGTAPRPSDVAGGGAAALQEGRAGVGLIQQMRGLLPP